MLTVTIYRDGSVAVATLRFFNPLRPSAGSVELQQVRVQMDEGVSQRYAAAKCLYELRSALLEQP